MAQDQGGFTNLSTHEDLHPAMKTHVLSVAVMSSCAFRDIEVVSFLIKNTVDLTELIIIDQRGFEKQHSPISAVLRGHCNRSFLDRELLELLFKNGIDINTQIDGSSVYHSIINSEHEDFAIEKLELIADINNPQYKKHFYMPANSKIEQEAVLGTYYLIEAIQQKKFKVAEAMIKMGAATDVQNSYGQSLLESSLVGPMLEPLSTANIEFIKYLFQNGYVTSLEEYSFCHK